MLEHLLRADASQYLQPDPASDFLPASDATPEEVLDARYRTASLMEDEGSLPEDDVTLAAQQQVARETFITLTSGMTEAQQKTAITNVTVPEAVRELVGMLTAYDWSFVEQAKELRGYTVAKITEETTHPDARIRLRALELLGKVTEVALFTERIEVKKTGMTDSELDEELKKRLSKYEALSQPVEKDVTPTIEGVKVA